LIFGDLGIIRRVDPGPEAYRSIVDGFGQYTRARWDGKIGSNEDLQRARVREEQEVREWLPRALGSDRYGGLLESTVFWRDRFLSHRAAGRKVMARHPGRPRLFLARHRCREPGSRGDVRGGAGVHVYRAAWPERSAGHALRVCRRTPRPSRPAAPAIRPRAEFRLLRRQSAAASCLALQHDRQLERAPTARASRDALCRADPHIRKFYEGQQRLGLVGNGAGSLRSGVRRHSRRTRGKSGIDLSGRPHLIGYFVDNELAWDLGNAADLQLRYLAVETLRQPGKALSSASSPRNIGVLRSSRQMWAITVHSWDDLL